MLRTLLILLALHTPNALTAEPLRIAVAANFRAVLEQVNAVYEANGGQAILLSSASTGVLATQISHGAPFDLFLAADRAIPAQLAAQGKGDNRGCYAVGQLVLVGGEIEALADPNLRLAIANPKTAPYGAAARQVLARPEFARAATNHPVRGANVLQAYQFWHAGAVDLALVARSQAPDGVLIPQDWYQPLQQHMLVLKDSAALRAYLQWLGSDTVRQMISDAGYLTCP